MLRDAGDEPGASALLAEARQLLASSADGAAAQLARLDRLERALASHPAGAELAVPLTGRETEVLRLLRGSLSLREIGQHLELTENTIKTHTRTIYRKLGVSGRRAAVARSQAIDLL
jgi:LuxR family maltose regulon positive regulatory protein